MSHVPIIIDSKKDADNFTTALLRAVDVGSTAEAKTFPPDQQDAVNAAMANLESTVGGTCSVLEGMAHDVKHATKVVADAMAVE
jgi:hypothetical protein